MRKRDLHASKRGFVITVSFPVPMVTANKLKRIYWDARYK